MNRMQRLQEAICRMSDHRRLEARRLLAELTAALAANSHPNRLLEATKNILGLIDERARAYLEGVSVDPQDDTAVSLWLKEYWSKPTPSLVVSDILDSLRSLAMHIQSVRRQRYTTSAV